MKKTHKTCMDADLWHGIPCSCRHLHSYSDDGARCGLLRRKVPFNQPLRGGMYQPGHTESLFPADCPLANPPVFGASFPPAKNTTAPGTRGQLELF